MVAGMAEGKVVDMVVDTVVDMAVDMVEHKVEVVVGMVEGKVVEGRSKKIYDNWPGCTQVANERYTTVTFLPLSLRYLR
ncbi:hypothetical protein Ddc_02904 [Ditylenchus destructor]|nr:hypothetical protein Ddc_02904 [Ditylenchus destructor]